MSWLDPRWQYHPAATHGDSNAFRERQIARALEAHAARVQREVCNVEPVESLAIRAGVKMLRTVRT